MSPPHAPHPVENNDRHELGPDTPQSLADEVRSNGLDIDPTVVSRIDAVIERATEASDLGLLHTTRALAAQGHGDSTSSAEDASTAIGHYVAAGDVQSAALASALAATFTDQIGNSAAAFDHAVESLVMLGDLGEDDRGHLALPGVRAAMALAGFFTRLSAFDLATNAGRRAFEGGRRLDGVPMDVVAFSFGYVAAEAAHVSIDEHDRELYLSDVDAVIDWAEEHGTNDLARVVLVTMLRGEARHARGLPSDDLGLDAGAEFYEQCPPDLVAWHRLVRATSALVGDRLKDAIDLFDLALPGLEASSDNHCIVRALRGRAEAHARRDDHERAYADMARLAELTRGWQLDQVGRLAFQLARRADLERSATELEATAARLADDIDRDGTTGVNSRRWLERHLDALSESDSIGAVIMCDVDRFKTVNDTYGHQVGDEVLRAFATVLADAVDTCGVVARYGGEEFVVVLDDAGADRALELAEQARSSIAGHEWSAVADGLALTVSCGVSAGPMAEVRRMLVDADQALLVAKRRGRDRVVSKMRATDP